MSTDEQTAKRTRYQGFEAVEIHRSEIKNAPYNPRSIAPTNRKRLQNSIKKHKLVDTLVFNARTGNIVGGHQRISAIDDLEGHKDYTLTVQRIDVDEDQEMQLNLSLNNPNLQGQFEADMQRQIFEHFISSGIDLEGAGYTTANAEMLFPGIFSAGQIADQEEAEQDDLNALHEIARVGKDMEDDFRDTMGLPPTKAMQEKAERDAARDSDDGDDGYDGIDTPGDQWSAPQSASDDAEPAAEGDNPNWSRPKEYFQERRQGVQDRNAPVLAETDVIVTFSFQTKEQLVKFLSSFGLDRDDPNKRVFDLIEVESAFGIELPR